MKIYILLGLVFLSVLSYTYFSGNKLSEEQWKRKIASSLNKASPEKKVLEFIKVNGLHHHFNKNLLRYLVQVPTEEELADIYGKTVIYFYLDNDRTLLKYEVATIYRG